MPQTKLYNYTIDYLDKNEYHTLKNEIFNEDIYHFETKNPKPYIIDAGAHIGMSTLYLKRLYPNAEIMAIEPNPITFELLEHNIWQNGLTDIKAINTALDPKKNNITLHQDPEGQWLSSTSIHPGAWNGEQKTKSITVPAQPLSDFIGRDTDLLKIDIEGAEIPVLLEAKNQLHFVQKIILECHAPKFEALSKLQKFLQDQGYKVSFHKKNKQINIQQAKGLFFIRAER